MPNIKKILILVGILLALLLSSCSPQTKESYLEDYEAFVNQVDKENKDYTDEDWKEIEEEYEKYNGEWYNKFEDEFTWKEELVLTKYQFQFNLMRLKYDSEDIGNLFNKEDYTELKKQLKYYTENKMDSDIAFIMEQAAEMGTAYAELVDSLLTNLNKE